MTLFLDVIKDFLIQKLEGFIQSSSKADTNSTTYGVLAGSRDLVLAAEKRTILSDLITSIRNISPEQDEQHQQALMACIQATERALQAKRDEKQHAPARTEESLMHLKAFIPAFYTKLEALKLLDQNQPQPQSQPPDPVFHFYHAIASYFAKRLSDGVDKTNALSTTVHWLHDHPSITPKKAFLIALDTMIERELTFFMDNLSGQNKEDNEGFQRRKNNLVHTYLDLLSFKHEALRQDPNYRNFGLSLSIDFLVRYLTDAKTAIQLDAMPQASATEDAFEQI